MRARTALVTGGGGRDGGAGTIGWAVSRLLARHGARVAVLDRDPEAAARTVDQIVRSGGFAVPVIADVARDEDCARAVREAREVLGSLDTLVNNVAAWSAAELFDVEPDRFAELLDVNLRTAWLMTRNALPVMGEGGSIVNITSVARGAPARSTGWPRRVRAMTGGAAYLLGERGIRANAVELGALWTAAVADNLPAEAREPRRRMVALQTEGDCWDAAWAVLFLASDQARWISGHVLTVDGGGQPRQPYPGVDAAPAGRRERDRERPGGTHHRLRQARRQPARRSLARWPRPGSPSSSPIAGRRACPTAARRSSAASSRTRGAASTRSCRDRGGRRDGDARRSATSATRHDARAMIDVALERHGRLDILVNNAAAPQGLDRNVIDEVPVEAFDEVIRINLRGTWLMCRAAVPAMRRGRWGRIINVASMAGVDRRAALHALLGVQGRDHRPDPGAGDGRRRLGHHRQRNRPGRAGHEPLRAQPRPRPRRRRRDGAPGQRLPVGRVGRPMTSPPRCATWPATAPRT